ncbi:MULTISPECIES: Uma2 family endonuclease [unclassified Streptomyces]|uniref:Uma2 family endonuclease n=1 Tax=unclassified Streptomyces TaxID=2593676 RepID=UPI0034137918
MSALTVDHEPHQGWDDLVRVWEQTDAPEGYKVEIIEGIITVSPSPSWDHNSTAYSLLLLLAAVIPADWKVFQTQEAAVPGRMGLYIPDLMVAAQEDRPAPGDLFHASRAKLVVEVTSRSNANHDRVAKLHGYAQAGVPLYLLLDAWHSGRPTATLYGEPEGGTYRMLQSVEYGGKVTLPPPFDLTIDTTEFPVS